MMKMVFLLLLFFFTKAAFACASTNLFDFRGYSVAEGGAKPYGDSVTATDKEVRISTAFIDGLLINPTGKNLEKNREELFYLISRSNKKAVQAGLKVLSQLINHPEYVYECDEKHEVWKKEEVAFVLSRSWIFHEQLCNVSDAERKTIVSFFEEHPDLYGLVIDPPWVGDLVCEKGK